ncbi:hypothetical protein NN3_25110 [Nocardia neocaledoniensis NBRC 108232]|nr:hypothetical protein NN3_25110 [Nocardia neocaledoniensis NBRC 108232]
MFGAVARDWHQSVLVGTDALAQVQRPPLHTEIIVRTTSAPSRATSHRAVNRPGTSAHATPKAAQGEIRFNHQPPGAYTQVTYIPSPMRPGVGTSEIGTR